MYKISFEIYNLKDDQEEKRKEQGEMKKCKYFTMLVTTTKYFPVEKQKKHFLTMERNHSEIQKVDYKAQYKRINKTETDS